MKKMNLIYIVTFIVAYCSIVYELILGQSLSAFLGNTVLRYSITIGLYLLSMGFGAIFAEGKFTKKPFDVFIAIEIFLTVLGGLSVVLLHFTNMVLHSELAFSVVAHSLIIIIGVLTGFEIPLLIEMRNLEKEGTENVVLGVDYAGSFIGSIIFAFVLYPVVGLVPAAFLTGVFNALAGMLIFAKRKKSLEPEGKEKYSFLFAQSLLFIVLVVLLLSSSQVNEFLIQKYLLL